MKGEKKGRVGRELAHLLEALFIGILKSIILKKKLPRT